MSHNSRNHDGDRGSNAAPGSGNSNSASLTSNMSSSIQNSMPTSNAEQEAFVSDSAGVMFNTEYRRHEDLKDMLESSKDNLKLDAMKRVIAMIAKGKDMSSLFPAVVKNVVSKNVELKKLVYSYLERYAEENEDVALLSISAFQRALKEPNPLIRAGALRVLSSIRIPVITPIVMIAIREATVDMSAYVRKTAAHAISKLYSLDKDTKPELIALIERLLDDTMVVVLSSAVMAFTIVCPEKQEFIHKIYRKLCNLISDIDEWGQIVIINVLTRYARTQFANPCTTEESLKSFYDSDSDGGKDRPDITLDPDHRLLLRSARPLLQSRNAAVVMAVVQMYYHIGPATEIVPAVKALMRLLKSNPEVQELVLHSIATMSLVKKEPFKPYLKSFYVRTSDTVKVKYLKLVVLSNIATDENISTILRELETYVSGHDDDLIAATVQAVGRCACFLPLVTHTCLNGLVRLLANSNDVMVAESVLVIKRLLQSQEADYKRIIKQMTNLMDSIDVPQARASIIWLLGEHCRDYRMSTNVLKKVAKTFPSEVHGVKLQILNLAVKLHMSNKERNELTCQYIFNLAKYDPNYDIRDRARLLRNFVDNPGNKLLASAAKIFLSAKPAPSYRADNEIEELQLGSLSHSLGFKTVGYESLPEWPKVPPPGDVRDVEVFQGNQSSGNMYGKGGALADITPLREMNKCDSWESETSSDDTFTDEAEAAATESEDEEDGGHTSESKTASESEKSSAEEESSEEESSSSGEEDKPAKKNDEPQPKSEPIKEKSNLDLLLDLDDDRTFGSMLTPSLGGFLSPMAVYESNAKSSEDIQVVLPGDVSVAPVEILDRISGKGLSISYRFTRNPHLYSPKMVNLNMLFSNSSNDDICDVRLGEKTLSPGMSVHEFACISTLSVGNSLPGTLGIDFNDSLNPATLEVVTSIGNFNVCIKPTFGELLRPVTMKESIFQREQAKLKGMNEHSSTVKVGDVNVQQKIYKTANLGYCPSEDANVIRFGGQTLSSSSLVLVTVVKKESEVSVVVNCEKLVVGSMLLIELKSALE